MFELRSARFLAAAPLSEVIEPGDTVVDATAGNGHDTCFLAERVGPAGHVWAFDVQASALQSTEARLREKGLLDRVTLVHASHARLREFVSGPVRTVSFNLGWLPGGDKQITTHWDSTEAAVTQALSLLAPLGLCTVCAYPGHPAGDEERRQLQLLLAALRPQEFNVLHERFLNAGPGAPECFTVQRLRPAER